LEYEKMSDYDVLISGLPGVDKHSAMSDYDVFRRAFYRFNDEFFSNQPCPPCLITMNRRLHSYGYFWPARFDSRTGAQTRVDEIGLNPDTFKGRTDEEIFGTLLHEMVHCWQRYHGSPGRGAYHNREWADKMKSVGLQPVCNDDETRETGDSVTHTIIPGGVFDVLMEKMRAEGISINWESFERENGGRAVTVGRGAAAGRGGGARRRRSKQKFTCPHCHLNVWGAPSVRVLCGACYERHNVIRFMTPED
jgi:hypothetical protein